MIPARSKARCWVIPALSSYVQLEIAAHPGGVLRAYATEALAHTSAMPPKVKKAPKAKKASKGG